MATSAIRARISAFESMSQPSSLPVAVGPRKPPIKLANDHEQRRNVPSSILDSSSPPASSSLAAHQPIVPVASRSPSPAASAVSDFVNVSPPRNMPPRLPPRKASGNTSTSSSISPGPPRLTASSSSSSSLLSPTSHSSVTVGGSYPPSRGGKGHAYANSTSSFHSVSLSDAVEELDGSFEALSTPRSMVSAIEPATKPPTSPIPLHAPALPPRPGASIVPITPTTPMPHAVRSKPPPPPSSKHNIAHKPSPIDTFKQDIPKVVPRSSRSSLISSNSTSSSPAPSILSRQSTATRRRPPLPPAVKARYDAVFDVNMRKQHQREQAANAKLKHSTLSPPRRAVGWRGVSIDLTTNGAEDLEGLEQVLADAVGSSALPDEERLPGSVVRLIWSCSKLPKDTLRKIWADCDSNGKGSLNKQEFAAGMWSVDCELSSAQAAKTGSLKRSGTTNAARRLTAQC